MYTKDRPVGYNREGLFTVGINTPELDKHYESLRTELMESGLAQNVAASSMLPTAFENGNGLNWAGKPQDKEGVMFRNVNVTPDYGKTVGWTIIRGRDFSRAYGTDTNAMVINDTAFKAIGVKDIIGQTVSLFGRNYTVIGVAANMVSNSPYAPIEPAIFCGGQYCSNIIVRIKPGLGVHAAIDAMQPIFRK